MSKPLVVTISHTLSRQDAISRLRERIGRPGRCSANIGSSCCATSGPKSADFAVGALGQNVTGPHRRDGQPFSRRTAIAVAARRIRRAYHGAGAKKSSAPPRPGWQQDGQSLAQLACLNRRALTARRSKGRRAAPLSSNRSTAAATAVRSSSFSGLTPCISRQRVPPSANHANILLRRNHPKSSSKPAKSWAITSRTG